MGRRGRPRTTGNSHNRQSGSYAHCKKRTADLVKATGGGMGRYFTPTAAKRPKEQVSDSADISEQHDTLPHTDNPVDNSDSDDDDDITYPEGTEIEGNSDTDLNSSDPDPEPKDLENLEIDNSGHDSTEIENGTEAEQLNNVEEDDKQHDNDKNWNPDHTDGRKFSSKQWETRFTWLYYNNVTNGYHCKVCEVWFSQGKWANDPCKLGNHPGRILSNHQNSERHQHAQQSMSTIRQCAKKGNVYAQLIEGSRISDRDIVEKNRTLIKKLIKSVHFMSVKKWATRHNFSDFIKFAAKELDSIDLKEHICNKANNATYLSSHSVDEFTNAIGTYLEENTIVKIKAATDLTVSADETTIVDGREELAVFVSYYDEIEECVCNDFIGLVHVAETTSSALLETIKRLFIAKDIDIKKVRFSGLDGTNSMSGEISGLQRRLRNESPHMMYMNCRNHRLALVLVHLMKEFSFIADVDATLEGIWKLFHYSGQKHEILKQAQEIEGLEILKILKVATTRWLTHGEACVRLLSRFSQVLDSLDAIIAKKNCPTSIGLRNLLLKPNTIKGLLILADVLKVINVLCKILQERNLPLAKVSSKVTQVKEKVHDMLSNEHSTHRCWLKPELAEKITKEAVERSALTRTHRSGGSGDRPDTVNINKFKIRLIEEIDKAFQVNPVLSSFDIFNPDLLPPQNDVTFSSFALAEIDTLSKFYAEPRSDVFNGRIVEAEAIIHRPSTDEVKHFKESYQSVKANYKQWMASELNKMRLKDTEENMQLFVDKHNSMKMDRAYNELKQDGGELVIPNILRLFKLGLIIPTSTAEVERGFSCLNLLCTDLRSKLSQQNLEHLMRMNLLSKSRLLTDQDWENIVDVFDRKPRRLLLKK